MAVAAALAGVGTGLKVAGALRQANADANVSDYNANIADQNAEAVEAQGEEMSRRSLINSRKMVGAQGAAYGASGVSGGSAEWVMRSSAAQGELNALTLKNNADIKATAYRNEASLDRFRSGNQRSGGYLNAAASLVGASGSGGGGGGGGTDGPSDAAVQDAADSAATD